MPLWLHFFYILNENPIKKKKKQKKTAKIVKSNEKSSFRHLESNYTHQCGPTDSCYQEMAEVERNNVDGYVFGYEKYQNLMILHVFLGILYVKVR